MIRKRLLILTIFLVTVAGYWQVNSVDASVGLTNFRAVSVATGIKLSWETGFEQTNLGFNLFRAEVPDREQASLVNPSLIPTQGNGNATQFYDYLDETVAPNIQYYYWIETVGDVLAEPVPPATAIWGSGGGIVTNTPGPTPTSTATGTATPTPTITPTIDPSASVTPTSDATNTPTVTVTSEATSEPGTVTPTATEDNGSAATEEPAGSSNDTQPTPTIEQIQVQESGDQVEAEAANDTTVAEGEAIAAEQDVAANQSSEAAESGSDQVVREDSVSIGQNAASIGDNVEASSKGTTLTGSVVEREGEGISTSVLMLLIAGGVFLIGGGTTAFLLLRQNQPKSK